MKLLLRIGLVMCFYVFSASALITQGQAAEYAEYFIYKDPYGRLVISNKVPPDNSSVIATHHLREPSEQVPQRQKGGDPQPKGRPEALCSRRRTSRTILWELGQGPKCRRCRSVLVFSASEITKSDR